jgi:hypothetical protein
MEQNQYNIWLLQEQAAAVQLHQHRLLAAAVLEDIETQLPANLLVVVAQPNPH